MPRWETCRHCGTKRDTSGRFTSPANANLDHLWWGLHLTGNCQEADG